MRVTRPPRSGRVVGLRGRWVALVAAATVSVACGGDEDRPAEPVELQVLEGDGGEADQADDADDAGDPLSGDGAADGGAADGGPGEGDGTTGPTSHGDGPAAPSDGAVRRGLAEGEEAAGVYAVWRAGTVAFVLTDDGLRIGEVAAADGWRERSRDVDDDTLQVRFVRDGADDDEVVFEVERDDDQVRLRLDVDVDRVEPGTFAVGEAATVTVAVRDGELVVDELAVADGWQLTDEDVDDDEVTLELRRGDERWIHELELSDGALSLEAEYRSAEVRGRGRR